MALFFQFFLAFNIIFISIESPVTSPVSPSGRRPVAVAPVPVTFQWTLGGNTVSLAGSFNGWKQELIMHRGEEDGDWTLTEMLPPGEYRCTLICTLSQHYSGVHQYKFIVDGVWRHHPDQPTVHDEVGNINNFVEVVEASTSFLSLFFTYILNIHRSIKRIISQNVVVATGRIHTNIARCFTRCRRTASCMYVLSWHFSAILI